MPAFVEVASVISGYSVTGAVSFEGLQVPGQGGEAFNLGASGAYTDNPAVREFEKLLGLRPGLEEVEVAYGARPEGDDEIAMLTQTMIGILYQLAYQVDVPAEHVTEGCAYAFSVPPSHSSGAELGQLIKIHHGTEEPEHVFTAMKYRDLWFWIDDYDFKSKRTFLFVMILFSLSATGCTEGLPPGCGFCGLIDEASILSFSGIGCWGAALNRCIVMKCDRYAEWPGN